MTNGTRLVDYSILLVVPALPYSYDTIWHSVGDEMNMPKKVSESIYLNTVHNGRTLSEQGAKYRGQDRLPPDASSPIVWPHPPQR